jgi:hypothetical protein
MNKTSDKLSDSARAVAAGSGDLAAIWRCRMQQAAIRSLPFASFSISLDLLDLVPLLTSLIGFLRPSKWARLTSTLSFFLPTMSGETSLLSSG